MALKTRSDSSRFLIGHVIERLPECQLATKQDVLKYLFHKKLSGKEKRNVYPKLSEIVCCPMKTNKYEANCEDVETCTEDDPCVVRAVKQAWIKAGFPVITDQSIRLKVLNLNQTWMSLDKNKKKNTEVAKESRKSFEKDIKTLFWISVKDLKKEIESDRLRTSGAIKEDIAFLEDQVDPLKRKMSLGDTDTKYETAVQKKEVRLTYLVNEESEPSGSKTGMQEQSSEVSEEMESDLNSNNPQSRDEMSDLRRKKRTDEDYVYQENFTKKPKTITLNVPTKILKETAMSSARCGVSSRSQAMTVADMITKSGGDLKDFAVSQSTANRYRRVGQL